MTVRGSRTHTPRLHNVVSLLALIGLAGIGLTLLVAVPMRSAGEPGRRGDAYGATAPLASDASLLPPMPEHVPVPAPVRPPGSRSPVANAASLVHGEEDPRAMLLRQAAQLRRASPIFRLLSLPGITRDARAMTRKPSQRATCPAKA